MSRREKPLSPAGIWLTRLVILAIIAAVVAYFVLLK